MAVNKVIYGGKTLIDLSDSTVTADKLAAGETAYAADGEKITGTMEEPLTTETWMLTLEDGSSVTKEVYVG